MENLEKEIKNIKQEILIHKNLKFRSIVRLFGYFFSGNRVYLVLEYASGGSLFSFVRKTKGLTEQNFQRIFRQVCQGVGYLHQKNIIHRDIKPENILIDHRGDVKLCDFGWSAVNRPSRKTFCGTYEYMAPEIFESKKYNHKVDIWSLGILLFELLHGFSPFRGPSVLEIYKNILRNKIPFKKSVCPLAKNLILQILHFKMHKRLEIGEILNHPYMKKFKRQKPQQQPIKTKNKKPLPQDARKQTKSKEELILEEFYKTGKPNSKIPMQGIRQVKSGYQQKDKVYSNSEIEKTSRQGLFKKNGMTSKRKEKPSQETATESNQQKSDSSGDKRGQSFKKKLKMASLKSIFNSNKAKQSKDRLKGNKLKSESGGEYGVVFKNFTSEAYADHSRSKKKSILSSREGSPKKKSSSRGMYKKTRLNELLKQKKSTYQEKFAEYAFRPKMTSRSPNRKFKQIANSFNHSLKGNSAQKKFKFNHSNSNLVNNSNRSLQYSNYFSNSSNKNLKPHYYKESFLKNQKTPNKLFFMKKNSKNVSKDRSFHKRNLFNLNQLIMDNANKQMENGGSMFGQKSNHPSKSKIQKPISISNLAAYYETGKREKNPILRRTSEIQFLRTNQSSLASKRSNRSLKIFNTKERSLKQKRKHSKQLNLENNFTPQKFYESSISPREHQRQFNYLNQKMAKLNLNTTHYEISGKPLSNHKRHVSNNLEDLRPFKRPMSLSQMKKKLIPALTGKNLEYSIQFAPHVSQPSFVIGGSGDSVGPDSLSLRKRSGSKKRVKKLSIIQGSPNRGKFDANKKMFKSSKEISSNKTINKQTHSLRNLLNRKKLKKGFSIGNYSNGSFGLGEEKTQGRAQLTFHKSKPFYKNFGADTLNTSNSRLFKENPYNSYYQRE